MTCCTGGEYSSANYSRTPLDFNLTAEQKELRERARELACGPIAERAAEVDRSESYPWNNVSDLVDAGFFGTSSASAFL